ncbi:MAG: MarR family transcriptional regulator [Lachnospiraceae bacterium]|nr:MarR family transcriptional regulator [Robinsoniella sp.]MDY3765971.1 MarR family transcriptional regulator [Lachnospiraceae bacterium]
MDNYDTLNHLLVELFRDIMNIEEKAVITPEFKDITNNDMHIIEAIGRTEQKNMSAIAKSLSVTVGTLTIAINNLVKKGYVHRVRSEKDRRVVLISLTEKGRKAFDHHKRFHERMIDAAMNEIPNEEMDILVKALKNLTEFFQGYE